MEAVSELTPQEISIYRATANRRAEQTQLAVAKRYERAWEAAKKAAELLKRDYRVTRVLIFGSLIRQGSFTAWSDVDIAAWGITPVDTYRAIGAVWDSAQDVDVNLVIAESCRPTLLNVIESEGIEL